MGVRNLASLLLLGIDIDIEIIIYTILNLRESILKIEYKYDG
jgi:hypothetical protein